MINKMINSIKILTILFSISLLACNQEENKPAEVSVKPINAKDTLIKLNTALDSDMAKLSYIIGMDFMAQNMMSGVKLDMQGFLNGMYDVMNRQDSRIPVNEREEVMKKIGEYAQRRMMERKDSAERLYNEMSAKLDKIQSGFLEKNKFKKGVITTPSGMQYEVIKEGTGNQVMTDDIFIAKLKRMYVDGTIISDSERDFADATVTGFNVLQGWTEASSKMKYGGTYKFYFPSNLAYRSEGLKGLVPPNTIVVVECTPRKFVNKFDPSKFSKDGGGAPMPQQGR